MEAYCITKSTLNGAISLPPSKSQTLRAILFASLASGKSLIHHYLPSPDTEAMIAACRLLGASIDLFPDRLEIRGVQGKIDHAEDVIQAGNSGIVLRFCAAVGALSSRPIVITGDHSIRHQRPMQPLLSALSQLGAIVQSMRGDGYAPVIIQGPIRSGSVFLEGNDSQPVSALIIASAFAEGPIEINVTNPGEKPWISMTLHWLERLGIPYQRSGFEQYTLFGNAQYEGFEYRVPGDLSSAAFPIAAALITQSELAIHNADLSDCQGDKELISLFQRMGAQIEIDSSSKKLLVKKGARLSGVVADINDFIDALPILTVVACCSEGTTQIQNAAIARQKECNRLRSITVELQKMGAHIEETPDGLIIHPSKLTGTRVNSHQDHRMAMSLTVAGLAAEGKTHLSPINCIKKTFPSFLYDFNRIGARIDLLQEV